jgi:CheY-like chemotaxis protein
MPGVDGVLSTRMIRMLEREAKYRSSSNGQDLKRIPIIATSLSLDKDNRFDYIQTGYVLISPKATEVC